MSLQDWLDRADALGGAGRFFEAHEELEAEWKLSSGPEKAALQGLIQLAAGLHRLRLDPKKREGAAYLLDRGLEKLRAARTLLRPDTLDALESVIAQIRSGRRPAPSALRFGLRAHGP